MRGIKRLTIACLLIVTLGSQTIRAEDASSTFNAGLAAMQRGHYATAYRAWIDMAQDGNLQAKSNIGYLYENGLGLGQSYTRAMEWYAEAAEGGLAEAQHNLGIMYAEGRGTEVSWARALMWFKRAAEQDFAASIYMIGLSYYRGLGQLPDEETARHYFELSAQRGYAEAQYMLSYSLLALDDEDAFNAYVWAVLALDSGQVQAEELRDLARMLLEPAEIVIAEAAVDRCLNPKFETDCPFLISTAAAP